MASSQTLATKALTVRNDKLLSCVHCGLCLEACPTYVATGDENDSPRGRIYLMRAVESGRLASSSRAFERHINRCLGCRACESACPAGVEYGQLLESARNRLLQEPSAQSLRSRLLRLMLRTVWLQPTRLRFAFALSRMFRDVGLARLILKLKLLRLISKRSELALSLLACSSGAEFNSPPFERPRGTESVNSTAEMDSVVQIFKGCVMEGLFSRVNRATERVLTANGCKVSAPSGQVCCGALHAHAGDLDSARELARKNVDAFEDDQRPIISNAGGCGAMLVSYAHLLHDDAKYSDRARRFSARVRDISQQLDSTGMRKGVAVTEQVVTYDASCHLIHGQHAGDLPIKMLSAIPGLRFVRLESSDQCCGGAGVYNLMETELSERVFDEKLSHIKETRAAILATGNPGCHMQIAAGAELAGHELRVCHPVELLDRSYERAGFYD